MQHLTGGVDQTGACRTVEEDIYGVPQREVARLRSLPPETAGIDHRDQRAPEQHAADPSGHEIGEHMHRGGNVR